MIVKHCPWGRPGGGAPNEQIRRGNILLEGLYPESGNDCRKYILPPCNKVNKIGGGGAPLRSASGRILTQFRDDPNICFSDSMRNHVDIDLRYKSSPKNKMTYKMQLGNWAKKRSSFDSKNLFVVDKIIAEKEKMNQRRSSDLLKHDPWGKAGPGGAPWRNPREIGQSFMKSMGWTDKNTLQSLDTENKKMTPPDTQPKNHESIRENPEHSKPSAMHETSTSIIPQNCCCHNCCCGCGTKFYPNKTSPRNENQSPNKKCGNPQDYDGSNLQQKHKSKKSSNNQKSKSSGEKERPPRIKRLCMLNGGVELVPLLARRRAMQRPVNLSTTDVTKNPNANKTQIAHCYVFRLEEKDHLNELCRQINQKQRRIEINKEIDKQSSQNHFENLDSFWGRPGHGAPKSTRNKLNLNDLLYRVPFKAEFVL
ncbi:hypothetical protein HA402_001678 [Bradysia odoriphaga]|nr:hypothetical protein HA402_001678 [Bradysia odoriphaga]